MKVIINIPDETYKAIMQVKWFGDPLMSYVQKGVPLEKGHGSIDYEVAWKQLKHTLIDTKMEIAGMGNNPGLSNVERFNCISDTINLMDQIDGTEYDNRSLYDLWGKQNGADER